MAASLQKHSVSLRSIFIFLRLQIIPVKMVPTLFNPMPPFCIQWKGQKTYDFLMFSTGIEKEHCAGKKQSPLLFSINVGLKNNANFTGKHRCWSLFLIKLQAFRPANLLKVDSNTCFPVKFATYLRTPILKNICEQLFLPEMG